jgi:hypothetical protein
MKSVFPIDIGRNCGLQLGRINRYPRNDDDDDAAITAVHKQRRRHSMLVVEEMKMGI